LPRSSDGSRENACQQLDEETQLHRTNFSFRPYFRDAMRDGAQTGHFYAIGNKTQIPGYFISRPVMADLLHPAGVRPLGVIVVKVSLLDMQQAWRSNPEPIALSDKHGVIFRQPSGMAVPQPGAGQ
jgi:two-component system C4-dicarboxylate transport sensor histidine kinase DctB